MIYSIAEWRLGERPVLQWAVAMNLAYSLLAFTAYNRSVSCTTVPTVVQRSQNEYNVAYLHMRFISKLGSKSKTPNSELLKL